MAYSHGGEEFETTPNCKQRKLKSTEQTEIKVIRFTLNLSQGIKGNSEKDPFVGLITMVSIKAPLLDKSLRLGSCGCN